MFSPPSVRVYRHRVRFIRHAKRRLRLWILGRLDRRVTALPGSHFCRRRKPSATARGRFPSMRTLYVTRFSRRKRARLRDRSTGALTALSGSPSPGATQPSRHRRRFGVCRLPDVANSQGTATSPLIQSPPTGAPTTRGHLCHRPPARRHWNRSFTEHLSFTPSHFLDDSVSGLELSTTAGTLLQSQESPSNERQLPPALPTAQRHRRRIKP